MHIVIIWKSDWLEWTFYKIRVNINAKTYKQTIVECSQLSYRYQNVLWNGCMYECLYVPELCEAQQNNNKLKACTFSSFLFVHILKHEKACIVSASCSLKKCMRNIGNEGEFEEFQRF